MRFFTSDLHLGHARISELANRPFGSVDEMNSAIVERWNATVGKDDEVFVLGDVCMGPFAESIALAATLQGRKRLVPGNHDRVSPLYKGSDAKKAEWEWAYRSAGFTIYAPEFVMMIGGRRLAKVSHFPYDGDSHDEDRYAHARPKDDGAWLLHGHTHSKERVRGRQIHVGVDAWDFTPVPESRIERIILASEGVYTAPEM